MRNQLTYLLLAITLLTAGCRKVANDGIPSYLRIDAVEFETEPGQGFATQSFSDLWIEVDGENVGVFEFPLVAPILQQGDNKQLIVQAGVKDNGTVQLRTPNPFITVFFDTISLSNLDTTVVVPKFQYKANTEFKIVSGFDTDNPFNGMNTTTDASIVKYGARAGVFTVDSVNTLLAEAITSSAVALPGGTAVFMQFDYLTDNTFYVGIRGISATNEYIDTKVYVNPNEEWNTLYLDFSQEVSDMTLAYNTTTYRFYIGAFIDEGDADGTIYIDNFKVMHQ